jgi:hypothetical protein
MKLEPNGSPQPSLTSVSDDEFRIQLHHFLDRAAGRFRLLRSQEPGPRSGAKR